MARSGLANSPSAPTAIPPSLEVVPKTSAPKRPGSSLAPPPKAARPREGGPAVWSIRRAVSLGTMLLTSLVVVSVGAMAERNTRRALTAELVARLQVQANHLAWVSVSAMLTPYPELTLHPMLRTLRERQRELAIAVVTDQAGIIEGDADPSRLGQRFVPPSGLVPLGGEPGSGWIFSRRPSDRTHPTSGHREKIHPLPASASGSTIVQSRTLLLASVPVVHPNGTRLGTAYVGLRRSYIDEKVQATRRPLIAVLAAFLAASVLGSFLLTSVLLRPIGKLRAGLERIGRGDLDTHLDFGPGTELGRVAQTVNRMATDLKHAQVQAIERERLAHEMHLAQRIQRSLQPTGGLVEAGYVVTGAQRPAAEVGGDLYDVFRLPDGRIGVAIADVSGKGLAGCLVAAMLVALLTVLRESGASPSGVLAALDRRLSAKLQRGSFVTMFLAFIEPRSGQMTYASAGHHAALLVGADGGTEWLKAPGPPIGSDRRNGIGAALRDQTVSLKPGDLVLQTTDGIHETEGGPAGEPFGFDRLIEAACAAAPLGAQAVIDAVSRAVESWRGDAGPSDDETLVVVFRERAPAAADEGFAAPIDRVAEARARGIGLKLPSTLEALVRIDDWIGSTPGLDRLEGPPRELVRLALHELCANIIEHGYRTAPGHEVELWWVPSDGSGSGQAREIAGHFVILDQGAPFSADNWKAPDVRDPRVRKSRRGLGLDLAHRATSRLVVHPGTPIGNVTLVAFDRVAGSQPTEIHNG